MVLFRRKLSEIKIVSLPLHYSEALEFYLLIVDTKDKYNTSQNLVPTRLFGIILHKTSSQIVPGYQLYESTLSSIPLSRCLLLSPLDVSLNKCNIAFSGCNYHSDNMERKAIYQVFHSKEIFLSQFLSKFCLYANSTENAISSEKSPQIPLHSTIFISVVFFLPPSS